jgi:hypothetical protein
MALPFSCGYGNMVGVKPGDLMLIMEIPPEGIELGDLDTGTLFPTAITVTARLKNGPLIGLSLGIEGGKPVFRSSTFSRAPEEPPLTPADIHDVPLGAIFDEVVARVATSAFAILRSNRAAAAGEPHRFVSPEESQQIANAAMASRRGRPVRDQELLKVARILESNQYDPRLQVVRELSVSPRTASRWIAEARRRGYVKEEGTP